MEEDPRSKYLINTKNKNMYEEIWGSLYPSWNVNKNLYQDFKRAIAPYSPFALQQIPS
jgi:hypothetical protein